MLLNTYHPIMFSKEVALNKPTKVKVLDKNLVVWRTDAKSSSTSPKQLLNCVEDRCSHRGAKLSSGSVVGNCIECPYHGWQFDGLGKCTILPQAKDKKAPTKRANIQSFPIIERDGIVWMSFSDSAIFNHDETNWLNQIEYFVTDYFCEAPYSYIYQCENLLDPAHIHFVHSGFQGSRDRASYIDVPEWRATDEELYGYFVHDNPDVPDISIRFKLPSVIDVSIHNKTGEVVRKNIIHITPSTKGKCRVLFRDVAFKKFIAPENRLIAQHVDLFVNVIAKTFVDEHYQLLNGEVVNSIMDQDIKVITGQAENIGQDYFSYRYYMPTASDRLIVEYKKWLRRHIDDFINV